MVRWETDIWQEFTTAEWSDMILNMHKCTHSMSIKETMVKLHTRWYLAPNKVQLFCPSFSENSFRGCQMEGRCLHIFWSCPGLQLIWRKAASSVSQITGSVITLTMTMCLLFAPLPEVPTPIQKLAHTVFCAFLFGLLL